MSSAASADPVSRVRLTFRKSRIVPFSVELDRVALFRAFENHLRHSSKTKGWTNDPPRQQRRSAVSSADARTLALGSAPSQISAAVLIALRHFLGMADAADEFEQLFVVAAASRAKAPSEGAKPNDDRSTAADWLKRPDMKKARDVATLNLPRTATRTGPSKGDGRPPARTPEGAATLRPKLKRRIHKERSARRAKDQPHGLQRDVLPTVVAKLGMSVAALDHIRFPRKPATLPR